MIGMTMYVNLIVAGINFCNYTYIDALQVYILNHTISQSTKKVLIVSWNYFCGEYQWAVIFGAIILACCLFYEPQITNIKLITGFKKNVDRTNNIKIPKNVNIPVKTNLLLNIFSYCVQCQFACEFLAYCRL